MPIPAIAAAVARAGPILARILGGARTAGTVARAAGVAGRFGGRALTPEGGRILNFTRGALKQYKRYSPLVTGATITAGMAKGFSEEVLGNQQAVDSLRFLGGGGGYNPMGQEATPPITPLASQLGTTQYSEDQLGATGQLALDTFYTRHGR